MTQILSGIAADGIMVATDSMATSFDSEGQGRHFPVDKLFSVGSHAFIVSGGMGVSVELSRRFCLYAKERSLVGIEAIVAAGGAYLSDQYAQFLTGNAGKATEANRPGGIHFLVGGYSFRSRERPFHLALWSGEGRQLPLQRIRIGASVAIPRTLSAELRLHRLCLEKRPLLELMDFASQFLRNLAAVNPEVGPPFRFGTVTPAGFARLEG